MEGIRPAPNEALIYALMEGSTDAICITSLQGQVLDCNSSACKLFALGKDELLRSNIADIIPTLRPLRPDDTLQRKFVEGGLTFRTLQQQKDGTQFPIEVTASEFPSETAACIVFHIRDLSYYQQAQNEISHLQFTLHRRTEQMKALNAILLDITTSQDLQSLLNNIVVQAVELLSCKGGGFYICLPEKGEVHCVVSYKTIRDYTGTVLKYGDGLAGKVAQTGKPLIVDDYRTWLGRAPVFEQDQPFRAVMSAPVIWQEQVTGVIHVLDDSETRKFTPQDLELLTSFANQAAIAIENARLFAAERQRIAELEAVRQVSLSLTTSLELPQVLKLIIKGALDLLPEAFNGHIFLYNTDNGENLTFGSALTRDGSQNLIFKHPRPNGLTYTVARRGEIIVVSDMQKDALFTDAPKDWSGAIVGLPLKIGARVVGVMNVSFPKPRQFSDAELRVLQLLADQAALAIENSHLFERATTERRHLQLLFDISREISTSLDPDEILDRAISLTTKVFDGLFGEAFIYLPEEDRLSLRAVYGRHTATVSQMDRILDLRPGKGLVGWTAQQRKSACVPEVDSDPHWLHIPNIDNDVHSALSAPILAGDKLLGALVVFHDRPEAFSDEHLSLLEAICREVSLALSNARRYQQVQRRLAEITLIHNLAQTFNQRLGVRALFDEVVTQLFQKLGYSHIKIFLVENDQLVLKAFHGHRPEGTVFPLAKGIIGRVVRTGQPAFVPDVSIDPDYYPCAGVIVAELAVPIFSGDAVMGVLSVESEEKDQLTHHDLDLLEVIAGQISVALENAILYEKMLHHAEELEHIITQRTSELVELFNLSQEIGYSLSFENLLQMVMNHLHNAVHCDWVMSGLILSDVKFILISTHRPLSETVINNLFNHFLEVIKEKAPSPISPEQVQCEVRFASGDSAQKPIIYEITSQIEAPILLGQNQVGIITIGSEKPLAFSPEQEYLLNTFAIQASSAVERLTHLLTAQQRQLESLVEHLPIGVLLLDADFSILLANPLARQILTILNPEAIEGRGKLTRLGSLSVKEIINRQSELLPVEINLESPQRCIFSVQVQSTGNPISEELTHWIMTISDITEERQYMQRVQIQERLATVGQLAAGIAHDFNNIMAAILVYTDLLAYEQSLSTSGHEKLLTIRKQIERASSLIHQILDFSRKSDMELSTLDFLPLLKEFEKMLTRLLPETIQIEFAYKPGIYQLKGDPSRLQLVLMNLALNARDAMVNGGKLRLELDVLNIQPEDEKPLPELPPGKWVCIIVSDTGVGIPPEIQEHIFEPFFTTKPFGQGTGLGLSQVYGIIKQHNGYIQVRSQIGIGTSFIIYLPALEVEERIEIQPILTPELKGEGQSVLVVEDDPNTRQALQVLLESYGYQVLSAPNGLEAVQVLENSVQPISLVISDVVMPRMGGIDLLQILNERFPWIKTLLITGHPMDEENQAALETGNVRWLRKPFSLQEFTQAVQALMGIPT